MAEETQIQEAVEKAEEKVEDAAKAAASAEAAVEKAEAAAEKADAPKAEAAAEKASEAAEKAVEKVEEAKEAVKEAAETVVEEVKKEVEIPKQFKEVVSSIEKMTVLELAELVKVLEGKFGVSAAPVAVAAAAGAAAGGAPAVEEKSAYNIMLDAAGDQKINVIKAVREITGLGLAESKALVDAAPKEIKQNVPKADADEAIKKLSEAGAIASLK